MRQAILVVVLVSASFSGRRFVNGPGLSWAQTRVLRSLGLSDTGEIASVDLKVTASAEIGSDGATSPKLDSEPMREPAAPIPSLIAEGESRQEDTLRRRSALQLGPHTGSNVTDGILPRSRESIPLAPTSTLAIITSPVPSQTVPPAATITPTAGTSQPKSPRKQPVMSPLLDRDLAPAVLDSIAAVLPAVPIRSADSSSPCSSIPSAPKSVMDESDDWGVLQRKMQTLDVSRFNIEGQPGGRVVFSCLIPLAGRQAVAQHLKPREMMWYLPPRPHCGESYSGGPHSRNRREVFSGPDPDQIGRVTHPARWLRIRNPTQDGG